MKKSFNKKAVAVLTVVTMLLGSFSIEYADGTVNDTAKDGEGVYDEIEETEEDRQFWWSYGGRVVSAGSALTGIDSAYFGRKNDYTDTNEYIDGDAIYKYKVYNEDSVSIVGYEGTETDVTIPAMIDNKPVTYIMMNVFYECDTVKNVTIPEGIKIIEDIFYNCKNIENIYIPATVTYIHAYTDEYELHNLKNIYVAEGNEKYTSIDGVLCQYTENGLKLVQCPKGKEGKYTVPADVNVIGIGAFSNCNQLTEVEISEGIVEIEPYAFSECKNLINLYLPGSITTLGSGQYSWSTWLGSGMNKLENISVSDNNEVYQSVDGVLLSKDETELKNYPAGKSGKYTISDKVQTIGSYAFLDCKKITEIEIPDSVETIQYSAFKGCGFRNITLPDSMSSIGYYAFSGCSIETIEIPGSVKYLAGNCFSDCTNLKKVTFKYGVRGIADNLFNNCTSLSEVNLPDSLLYILKKPFNNCTSLKSIFIPKNVKAVDLSGADSITTIASDDNSPYFSTIDGVLCNKNKTGIVRYPTGRSDTSYHIPDTIESIEEFAFEGKDNIEEIYLNDNFNDISNWIKECENLMNIQLSEEHQYLTVEDGIIFSKDKKRLVFYPSGRDGENYTIPEGVEEISSVAFYNSKLVSIELPSSVKYILQSAFENCINLKNIEIPDGVVSIGVKAFYHCKSIEKLVIPEGVTWLRSDTFSGCESLEELIIPDTVTHMDSDIFDDCNKLKSITIPSAVEDFNGLDVISELRWSRLTGLCRIEVAEGNNKYASLDGVLYNKEGTELLFYPRNRQETTYTVPDGVEVIAGESLYYNTYLQNIIIPETVVRIESWAFPRCKTFIIPESVQVLGSLSCEELWIYNDNIDLTNSLYADRIYGRKGSTAEIYAEENNKKFISFENMISEAGIEVMIQNEDSSLMQLATKEINEGDKEYSEINISDKIKDNEISDGDSEDGDNKEIEYKVYDITLTDENNHTVQPKEEVIINIPVPDGYTAEECNVYRMEENGSFTNMNAEYVGNALQFRTAHLSIYIVTEAELVEEDILYGDLNGDGDINTSDAVLLKKLLAGYKDLEINEAACDINGDGSVTSADAVILQKYLAGYKDVVLASGNISN